MKKNLSELVFILDNSGSMHGFEADTVGGFNAMMEKQRLEEGEAFVSTVLFNTERKVLHDRVSLQSVELLKKEDFCVGGCTALFDAVGASIRHIENIHKYARKEDVPEHTVFVISTDGLENASKSFTRAQVKKMIERKTADGWEFIFLGANIDVEESARNIGISPDSAMAYEQSSEGIDAAFCDMSIAISARRRGNCKN